MDVGLAGAWGQPPNPRDLSHEAFNGICFGRILSWSDLTSSGFRHWHRSDARAASRQSPVFRDERNKIRFTFLIAEGIFRLPGRFGGTRFGSEFSSFFDFAITFVEDRLLPALEHRQKRHIADGAMKANGVVFEYLFSHAAFPIVQGERRQTSNAVAHIVLW